MELCVIDSAGKPASTISGADHVFAREYNEALVHQLVVAYQANARSASSKQKDREEVRHSTKKPFRQKGTGRARAGMTSSPLWRGGGRIFPNSPDENYSQKVNKKMYRAGLSVILSQLNREGRLVVMDDFTVDAPKTRLVAEKLNALGVRSLLVIASGLNEATVLASRNLVGLTIVEPHHADPVSLLRHEKVAVTRAAVARLEEALQ